MDIIKKIEEVKKNKNYFITISSKDPEKDVNDLSHFVFRESFETENIIPSINSCIESLNIKQEKPVNVITPPRTTEEIKPLKIAYISHFNRCPQSYSPARALKNQIKIMKEFGHDVTFFLTEGSKLTEEEIGCKLEKVVPKFKREKMVVNEDIKNKLIDIFKEKFENKFDVIITFDFFIQDTVTFSEAIRQCNISTPWLHFARSGVSHNMNFSMDNARFIYLNKAEIGRFSKAIKVSSEQCRAVYNEKDPSFMFNFDPVTKMIINKYELWDRDIIQTYPMCSTRTDGKGLRHVIRVFAELKRLGKKVMLIIPNSNGRKLKEKLEGEIAFAKSIGLNDDEFIFTSLLHSKEYNTESEVSNKICAELMQLSNLFVFASSAEVCPNILLESAIAKNLIVANEDLPLIYDFIDKDKCLSFPFTSNHSLHYKIGDNNLIIDLAKKIVEELDNNKIDLAFRQVWKNHNKKAIYNQLINVIMELINETKENKVDIENTSISKDEEYIIKYENSLDKYWLDNIKSKIIKTLSGKARSLQAREYVSNKK
jgi:hypothetical protein